MTHLLKKILLHTVALFSFYRYNLYCVASLSKYCRLNKRKQFNRSLTLMLTHQCLQGKIILMHINEELYPPTKV